MSEPSIEVLPAKPPAAVAADVATPRMSLSRRGFWAGISLLCLVGVAAMGVAWTAQQRVETLQHELVRRQQDSQAQSIEARMLAKQAQDSARDTAAKVALLEARLSEVTVQRGQLEELIQSLSRSRDESAVADIDAAIRVALQQAAITSSAEPLVAALKQADERLARYNQPRLEQVRRAIARDIGRAKAVGVADLSSLSIKLDEAMRMIDELPLLSVAEPRKEGGTPAVTSPTPHAAGVDTSANRWLRAWNEAWASASERVWSEVKSLVRVTRIDHPEAMLLAPEQAFFVRENLKLRLLNARLALLSRQFDTAQSDLQVAQTTLERYFDASSRRLALTRDLIKQVATQAKNVPVPRPDDTLAALATAMVGR